MNPQNDNIAAQLVDRLARMNYIFALQRDGYSSRPMPPLDHRRRQLGLLKALLIEHKDELTAAINADFTARSADETMFAEILPCIQYTDYTLKRLRGWMKPGKRSVGLFFLPASAQVVYQPLSVVGIIVPFNYPLGLALIPLVTARCSKCRNQPRELPHSWLRCYAKVSMKTRLR